MWSRTCYLYSYPVQVSLILLFLTSSFIHHNKLPYPVQVSLILLFPTSKLSYPVQVSLILLFPTSKLSYPVQVSLILLFPTSSFIHHILQFLLNHIDSKNLKYGKHSKILYFFVFLLSNKMLVIRVFVMAYHRLQSSLLIKRNVHRFR